MLPSMDKELVLYMEMTLDVLELRADFLTVQLLHLDYASVDTHKMQEFIAMKVHWIIFDMRVIVLMITSLETMNALKI